MAKILPIYIRFGEEDYPGAYQEFLSVIEPLRHDIEKVLIVDNSLKGNYLSSARDTIISGGNNYFREFSGWVHGYNKALSLGLEFDYLLLVTSAYRQLYKGYLSYVAPELLEKGFEVGAAIGHLDCYPNAIRILGAESRCWFRTCFVFVPTTRFIQFAIDDSVVESMVFLKEGQIQFSDEVSPNYQRYITDWLTGSAYDSIKWHSKIDIQTPEGRERFVSKARSILHEHLFKIRLEQNECPVIDIEYLAKYFSSLNDLEKPIDQIRRVRSYSVVDE